MFHLILIFFLAIVFRLYGINWDQGFHLHPDERALIMVTERIHFFDQLNPDFFNYGSLPIYILRGITQFLDAMLRTQISNYDGMLYVGRYLSIFFDLGTILIIYKTVGLFFKNKKISLLSSFFYAVAFFPIQNSHFFVVDVFLTFFATLLIYTLLKYMSLPVSRGRTKLVVFSGIVFAAMLSTKFTAILFYPIIIVLFIISAMKQWNNEEIFKKLLLFNVTASLFFFLFMPYAFLEYQRFLSDITAQISMNSNPYIFPYTLQYVGTLPYLYYLKNIFLWGLGPIISVLSLVGFLNLLFTSRLSAGRRIARRIIKLLFERSREQFKNISINNQQLTIFLFYFFYFLIIGRSAVKFMRYMLPLYPFFTILAGLGFFKIYSFFCHPELGSGSETRCRNKFGMTILILIIISTLILSFMFINIYSQKHTRVAATEWILQNIPKGSTIALEHWDDGLPLAGGENYTQLELPLYGQPDDEKKWQQINETLRQSDYIIIASNRLYVPLQKLSDCKKYKSCYPKTAEYYRKLFKNQFGFAKVAEFSAYPKLEVGSWKLEVDDQSADESFTVYDHPKIMIFKKI